MPEEARQRARSIMARQLGQLVRLIDEVVELARADQAPPALRRAPARLRDVVDAALQKSHAALAAREQTVQPPASTEDLPPLQVDAERLAQALAALLRDVSRHAEAGTCLALRAGVDADGSLVLGVQAGEAVSDTAPLPARLSVAVTLAQRLAALQGASLQACAAATPDAPPPGYCLRLPRATWR